MDIVCRRRYRAEASEDVFFFFSPSSPLGLYRSQSHFRKPVVPPLTGGILKCIRIATSSVRLHDLSDHVASLLIRMTRVRHRPRRGLIFEGGENGTEAVRYR